MMRQSKARNDENREKIMKGILTPATLGLLAMAAPAAAQTQAPDQGWYTGLMGGLSFAGSSLVKGEPGILADDVDLGKDTGWGISAFGGYDWGLFRTEIELAHRHNAAEDSGGYKTYSAMANLLADIPVTKGGVTLYGGGGLGLAKDVFDSISAYTAPFQVTGDDTGFAYQFIGGMRVPFTDTVSGHLDYRYFKPSHADIRDSFGNDLKGVYSAHTIMAGVSVLFGGQTKASPPPSPASAPPPPPPAPEPVQEPEPAEEVPAGPFLVFFEFDSARITPSAQQVLQRAVEAYRQSGQSHIQIDGYTDRAGDSIYNQALSQKRAAAVRQALMDMGVDPGVISTQGFGEENPLVPTPDGVAEAQNRRAEIILGD